MTPAPRSHTRSRSRSRRSMATRWTLIPSGYSASSAGPIDGQVDRGPGPGPAAPDGGCRRRPSPAVRRRPRAHVGRRAGPGRRRAHVDLDPQLAVDVATDRAQRSHPAAVSIRSVPSSARSARSSAWPRHRMPLPEISASEPSALSSTMQASWSRLGRIQAEDQPVGTRSLRRSHSAGPVGVGLRSALSAASATRKSLPRPWCLVRCNTSSPSASGRRRQHPVALTVVVAAWSAPRSGLADSCAPRSIAASCDRSRSHGRCGSLASRSNQRDPGVPPEPADLADAEPAGADR